MWRFQSPEVVFGEDALSVLAELSGERAYIITDENIAALGFVELVQEQLALAGIETAVFAEVEPDPSIETIRRAEAAITAHQPDIIVGLGGGSCLDASKVAWFLYENPGVDLEEINPFMPFDKGRSLLVAVSTTSGTGADATMGVVLTDTAVTSKIVLYAREMMPQLAIVDPVFVAGLPAQITADTGLDVISHAVEAFAGPWANDFADGLCLQALKLVFTHLPQAYAGDLTAREKMHNAATIAGMGMNNSSIALAHALAHALGAVFHKPHGRLVGLCLPYTIEYTANGGGTRYAEITRMLGRPAADEAEGAANLAGAIRDLAQQLNQPLSLAEMGIDAADFEAALVDLAAKAAEDKQMLTTLRVPDDDELARLFRCTYEGRPVDF